MKRGARAIGAALIVAIAMPGCLRPGNRSSAAETVSPPEPVVIFSSPLPEHARVTFETDAGAIQCEIDPARVPRAAAMVVGLARGKAPFRDAHIGLTVQRPYYDGLTFFRRMPGEIIQTGCPNGDGTGHPGFRIAVETTARDAEILAQPGALFLAHYQAPPHPDPDAPPPDHVIGSQLVISLVPLTQNLGAVTVLGRCGDLDVVRRISTVPQGASAPVLRALRTSW
jgi:cyclophilin family peptidyl-prolyl cis-trans isomerase